MDKKAKILHIIMIFVVSAGLLFITESWWMSLGILMLLLLADAYIQAYQKKKEQQSKDNES
jgi:positive regulator of sigma E activity